MSEPPFDVTYRVSLGNLNAFFGAWLKRTWFDKASWKRVGLYTAALAIFLIWSIWHYVFGGRLTVGFAPNYLLILGTTVLVAASLLAAVIVFILFPMLIYFAQMLVFAFGPARKRTTHVQAHAAGIDKTTGDVTSQTKWRAFPAIVETKKSVVLFTSRNSATIVPKTAFASPAEAQAFAAFAKAQWTEAQSVF